MSKQGATSIHLKRVKGNSEAHNERKTKKEMPHIRKDLTPLNESFVKQRIGPLVTELKKLVKELTGKSMQDRCTPVKEGVIVIKPSTTMDDLKKFGDVIKEKYGLETIQIHIHHDEGHTDENGAWKENCHAHILFDMIDHETGRTHKLYKKDTSDMQTILAEVLGMERGESSSQKHLQCMEYKEQQAIKTAHMQEGMAVDASRAMEGAGASLLASSVTRSLSDLDPGSDDRDVFTMLRKVAKTIGLKPAKLVADEISCQLEMADERKLDKLCSKLKIDTDGMNSRADKANAVRGLVNAVADTVDVTDRDAKLFRPIITVSKALNALIVPILRNAIQFKVVELSTYPEISSKAAVERLAPQVEKLDETKLKELCDAIDLKVEKGEELHAVKNELKSSAVWADKDGVSPSDVSCICKVAEAVGTSVYELKKEPRVMRQTVNDVLIPAVDKMDDASVKKICDEFDLRSRNDFYPADMKVCVRNSVMESTRAAEKDGMDANTTKIVKRVAEIANVEISSLPKTNIQACDKERFDVLWKASAMLGDDPHKLLTESAKKGMDQLEVIGAKVIDAEEKRDNAIQEREKISAEIDESVSSTLEAVGCSKAEVIKSEIFTAIKNEISNPKINVQTVIELARASSDLGMNPVTLFAEKVDKATLNMSQKDLEFFCKRFDLPQGTHPGILGDRILYAAKICDENKDYSKQNLIFRSFNLSYFYNNMAEPFAGAVEDLSKKAENDPESMAKLEKIAERFGIDEKSVMKAALSIGKQNVENGRKELLDALEKINPSIAESMGSKKLSEVINLANSEIKQKVDAIGGISKLEDENRSLKDSLVGLALKQYPAIKTLYDAGLKSVEGAVDHVVELLQDMKTKFVGKLTHDGVTINFSNGAILSREEGNPTPFVNGKEIGSAWKEIIDRNNEQSQNRGPKL